MSLRSLGLLACLILVHHVLKGQIVNVESARLDENQSGWQGLVDLNFMALKNNAHLFQLNNKLRTQFVKGPHRWLLLHDININMSSTFNFEQNTFQHLRYGWMVDSPLVLEAFVQNQYDKIQRIKHRLLAGAGLRLMFMEKGLLATYYGITAMGEYEQEINSSTGEAYMRLSTYLNLKFTLKEWLHWYNTAYYQPLFRNVTDYRVMVNSSLEIKLNHRLSMLTRFGMNYDSNPVDNALVPAFTYRLTNGFAYKI
ncbi:MAG: DUF481 domain-containing protein [Bacteroidetes bacterium]|nr:DUF481 domain-containing protein [Bacteroidota bacterium]